MKAGKKPAPRKRRVNLTLNGDLVAQAREFTANLSGVVDSLLADFLARERQRRAAKAKTVEATVALWNEFHARVGSFADEHSTL